MADRSTPSPFGGDGHAVVIGGSTAGLMAARVLSNHFERVTLVERDPLPDGYDFRKGVPQARHVHVLLPGGQAVVEGLFSGLTDELVSDDATFSVIQPTPPYETRVGVLLSLKGERWMVTDSPTPGCEVLETV